MNTLSLDTPIGTLVLHASDRGLTRIELSKGGGTSRPTRLLERAAEQLLEYFAGVRAGFDLPLDPQGSPFDLAVWRELRRIPHGGTISYAELARRVGRPSAARAVGGANGRNPLPIVVPCHRVIASDGLGGYAGGLAMKRVLLDLEARQATIEHAGWPPPSSRARSRARERSAGAAR